MTFWGDLNLSLQKLRELAHEPLPKRLTEKQRAKGDPDLYAKRTQQRAQQALAICWGCDWDGVAVDYAVGVQLTTWDAVAAGQALTSDERIFPQPGTWWADAPFVPRAWQAEALGYVLWGLVSGTGGQLVRAIMGAGKSKLLGEVVKLALYRRAAKVVVTTSTQALVRQLRADLVARLSSHPSMVGAWWAEEKNSRARVVVCCNDSLPSLQQALEAEGQLVSLLVVDEAHQSQAPSFLDAVRRLNQPSPLRPESAWWLPQQRLMDPDAEPPAIQDARQLAQQRLGALSQVLGTPQALVDQLAQVIQDAPSAEPEIDPATQPWPPMMFGLSATPYRASASHALTLFSAEVYSYGAAQALAEGVVVPWEIVPSAVETDLDEAVIQMALAAKGPGVVTAGTIADADQLAVRLQAAGVPAMPLHSRQALVMRQQTLDLLRTGQLKVVVAVNCLTEGVDLPWLLWVCLRRPMTSRVAFAQLVGRALRAHQGLVWGQYTKTRATLYDPWNLFDTHRLSHEAALGAGVDDDDDDAAGVDVAEADETAQAVERERKKRRTRTVRGVRVYLLQLAVAAHAVGLVPAPKPWGRTKKVSPAQLQLLEALAPKLRPVAIPEVHKALLRDVYAQRANLRMGQASDLIELFRALPRQGWPAELGLVLDQPE